MNKRLADWIALEQKKGHTTEEIKSFLSKKGFKKSEIAKELEKHSKINEPEIKELFKESFKPNLSKIIFPIIVFILIMISFFVNITFFPHAGKDMRNIFEFSDQISNISETYLDKKTKYNVNPDEIIELRKKIEEKIAEKPLNLLSYGKPLVLSNVYLSFSGVYKLNPFFPMPCETILFNDKFVNHHYCRHYILKEDYEFFKNFFLKNQNTRMGFPEFIENDKDYKKANFFGVLVHGIIISIMLYILIGLISFAREWIFYLEQNKKKMLNYALFVIIVIVAYAFNSIYLASLIPFLIIFIISTTIKNKKVNQRFIYISSIIFILILLIGLIIGNLYLEKKLSYNISKQDNNELTFLKANCENTKILNMREKEELFGSFYEKLNEEWNVCYEPSCKDICIEECNKIKYYNNFFHIDSINLRGDKPSCICIC
jgi:hypothetical protein